MRNGRMGRYAAVAAGAATLMLASGCGGGSGEAAEEETQPLEEQLGIDDESILERQAKAENLVRDCMKGEGFDYVPLDPAAARDELVGRKGMSSEEFEKEFGYGITTLYEQRLEQAVAGPNEEVYDQLAPGEQAAYDRSLYGEDTTATIADAIDTGDYSRLGGCTREAAEKVFGGAEVLSTLAAKLDELDDRMLADPRMVKAVRKWSACMEGAGFPDLDEPEEVDEVLQRQLGEIVGLPEDAGTTDYDSVALAELARLEVEMVTADIACEHEHITDVEEKVAAEYEQDFREGNASLLADVPGS